MQIDTCSSTEFRKPDSTRDKLKICPGVICFVPAWFNDHWTPHSHPTPISTSVESHPGKVNDHQKALNWEVHLFKIM